MKIWVMRHGEAGFNAATDSQRTLTKNGQEMAYHQGEKLGKRLLNQQIILDKIIVSPYLRTQQTAEQLFSGLQAVGFTQSCTKIVETWEGITPGGNVETVIDYLNFLHEEGAKNVLIISHLPLVFDLVHQLTHSTVHFYPAVIAELENLSRGRLISTLSVD